jgi:hypothetical protein
MSTTELAAATAAGMTVELNGVAYTLCPLRLRHWGEIDQAVRARVLDLAYRLIESRRSQNPDKPGIGETDKKIIMGEAFKTVSDLSCIGGWAPIAEAPDTWPLYLWSSVRQQHPTVKLEECEAMLESYPAPLTLIREIIQISQSRLVGKKNQPAEDPQTEGRPGG